MSSAPTTVSQQAAPPEFYEIKPERPAVFWREFLRKPKQLGTCFTSSKALARTMVRGLPLSECKTVFELGPGTGPITAEILPLLAPGTRFIGIEQNEGLVRALRERFPAHTFLQDDATQLVDICTRLSIAPGTVDAVLASVPYLLFPQALQVRGLDEVQAILRPGGSFTMLTYCIEELQPKVRRWRKFLEARFANVTRSKWVIANTPPAFVYRGFKP